MITVVLVTLLLSAACAEEERNNVIFIIADDFRPNIGALSGDNPFSSPEIRTPNLDKLAARSLVMTKAYTQVLLSSDLGSMFDEATLGSLSVLQTFKQVVQKLSPTNRSWGFASDGDNSLQQCLGHAVCRWRCAAPVAAPSSRGGGPTPQDAMSATTSSAEACLRWAEWV